MFATTRSVEIESNGQNAAIDDALHRTEQAIGQVIRGKEHVIRLSLIAVCAQGHLLIEDVPGVGKTTLARALAVSLGCTFRRIQLTSDMLPSDITGVSIFNSQNRQFEFRPGPIFAQIVLADEINRTTPKTQSALLEAMNENQVTLDGVTHRLPKPFMVIATQNPAELHGTFPLPESQLDRFLLRVEIGYPEAESEQRIIRGESSDAQLGRMNPVLDPGAVASAQEAARNISVDEALVRYLVEIVDRTRRHPQLTLGISPRGSQSLYRAAQASALLDGRDYCVPDDFKDLVIPVFGHRCIARSQFDGAPEGRGGTASILREILEEVPVPL